MILGINNFIEASNAAGEGLDLSPWASGLYDPRAVSRDANLLTEVTIRYDRFDDPFGMILDYADGSSVILALEAGRSGVFITSESHYPPGLGSGLSFFVGYGLSTAPDALRFSVEQSQGFFTGDEFDDIADGFLEPRPSFFTLDGHDEIFGAKFDDFLVGARGNDILRGRGGEDELRGGQGSDTLAGDAGDDALKGAAGADALRGGRGDDTLLGGKGRDELRGGDDDDRLVGAGADDQLYGDNGADTLRGGAGDDRLSGGRGADRLLGDLGDDTLLGGAGADTLIAGTGDDTLTGGSGADRFVFRSNDASNLILDYTDGVDKIAANGADGFADLFIFERNGDAVIRYDGVEITLDGVDSDLLDASDFLF